MRNIILFGLFYCLLPSYIFGQCTLNLGPDILACKNSTVAISASATGNPNLNWSSVSVDIISSGENTLSPTISTSTAGVYLVILKGNNNGECVDSMNITIGDSIASSPEIFVSSENKCSGIPFEFSTTPEDQVTYSWDFGDGSPMNSGFMVSNTYQAEIGIGTIDYTVTVNAKNSFGCIKSSTKTITLDHVPDASIKDYTSLIPFTNCGTGNFDLNIDNTSTTNSLYEINWGDGSTEYSDASLPNTGTIHSYTEQGFFTIELTVTNQNGCVSSKNYTVYNGSNPAVGIGNPGNKVSLCVPHSLTFPITGVSENATGTTYTLTTKPTI